MLRTVRQSIGGRFFLPLQCASLALWGWCTCMLCTPVRRLNLLGKREHGRLCELITAAKISGYDLDPTHFESTVLSIATRNGMSTGTGGRKERLYGRKNVDDVVLRPTTASTNTKRSTRNVGQRTPNKNLQVKEWQLPPPTSAERVWDGEELDKYDLQRQREIAAEKIQARVLQSRQATTFAKVRQEECGD